MNKTLFVLCRHVVGIMDGYYPLPAWAVAKSTGVSVSTARRRLRKLKEDGYADTTSTPPEPWEESDYGQLPYHGWTITEKAHETEEYKKALTEERKLCLETFGVDIAPELGECSK